MNPFRTSLIAASLVAALSSAAQHTDEQVDDLALITIGSPHRPKWTKDLLEPYVVHTFADGSRQWFFDGFMMIDGVWIEGDNVKYSYGEADYGLAPRELWEKLPDIQLGTESGYGCKALDELIGEWLPVLGTPGYKHQIVMTLPVPHQATMAWGKLDGVSMDFSSSADRIKVCKWYIDLVLKKWNACDFKNIELAGFFWIPEEVFDHQVGVAKEVNKYIHDKGYRSFFIPFHHAPNYQRWKEFGFDVTYIQPNYFFKAETPIEVLQCAIEDAYNAECGLEMEFEGYNYDAYGHIYSPANNGLYDFSPLFYQKFVDYVSKFEEEKAFDFMPLSYYNGYQAVYDFDKSMNPKDKEILHRLAADIIHRHVLGGWHGESASINEIDNGRSSNIYGLDGGIYVDNAAGQISLFSVDGRLINQIESTDGNADPRFGRFISCRPGVYIVRTSDHTVKVLVK